LALSRIKTWIAGEVLTASDLNAEYNNLLNNALTLISPLTGPLDIDGQTLTLDAAAATQVVSSAAVSWNFTSGAKTGTPGTGGSVERFSAQTFTDSATAGSGTATAAVFYSLAAPTLAATNASVTTTDAATWYIGGVPVAGTNETITNPWALWIDAGNVRFDDDIHWLSGQTFAQRGILAHANTGIRTYTFQDADGTIFTTAGGTITGDLTISKATPVISLDANTGSEPKIKWMLDGVQKWLTISGGPNPNFRLYRGAVGSEVLVIDVDQATGNATFSANLYVNDSANANSTLGLTINQGAADNEILALKSSDVAHGITDFSETDTFGSLSKISATAGGVFVQGFTEGTDALWLRGISTSENTTKSASSGGIIQILSALKSGTGKVDASANANLLTVVNNTTTRFILDADGDSHQDVGTAWTNFDAQQDVDLLTALSVHVSAEGDPIKRHFASFLDFNRQRLQDLKLVTFNEDGHHFVNMSKLTMLLTGAVRQMSSRMDAVEQKLLLLEAQ